MDRTKIDMNFNGKRNSGIETKLYRNHLRVLRHPPRKVDNSAPTLAVACYYNNALVSSERSRLVNIELENRMLLKIINEIYRTKGKIDTSDPQLKRSTNFYERLFKNRKLEQSNKKFYSILKSVRPTLPKAVLDREYKKALEKMMFQARYPEYYSSLLPELELWDICPFNITDRTCCTVKKRVQCYMDVAIDDSRTSPQKLIKLGRLYMEIYRDYAPATADNFLQFINGYEGRTFKGTQFFRIQKCVGCIGGDVECNDGGGYYSIGGKCFPDENHILQFNGPGVISTFTLFPGHNHSHFFISFQKLDPLNGKFVVFGRLIKTLSALERIEECGTLSGTPKQKIVVADCGFLGKNSHVRENIFNRSSPEKNASDTSGEHVRGPIQPEERPKSSMSPSRKFSTPVEPPSNTGATIN